MTNAILIEPAVPMPLGRPRPANARYPFAEMAVGDSFAVPPEVSANAIRATARYHAKKLGRTFKARADAQGSLRVWRTA